MRLFKMLFVCNFVIHLSSKREEKKISFHLMFYLKCDASKLTKVTSTDTSRNKIKSQVKITHFFFVHRIESAQHQEDLKSMK